MKVLFFPILPKETSGNWLCNNTFPALGLCRSFQRSFLHEEGKWISGKRITVLVATLLFLFLKGRARQRAFGKVSSMLQTGGSASPFPLCRAAVWVGKVYGLPCHAGPCQATPGLWQAGPGQARSDRSELSRAAPCRAVQHQHIRHSTFPFCPLRCHPPGSAQGKSTLLPGAVATSRLPVALGRDLLQSRADSWSLLDSGRGTPRAAFPWIAFDHKPGVPSTEVVNNWSDSAESSKHRTWHTHDFIPLCGLTQRATAFCPNWLLHLAGFWAVVQPSCQAAWFFRMCFLAWKVLANLCLASWEAFWSKWSYSLFITCLWSEEQVCTLPSSKQPHDTHVLQVWQSWWNM